MRIRQAPSIPELHWDMIAGKPTEFPSRWDMVSGKPTEFPTRWDLVGGRPTAFPPAPHASQHATGGSDPLPAASLPNTLARQFSTPLTTGYCLEAVGSYLLVWGDPNHRTIDISNPDAPVEVAEWPGQVPGKRALRRGSLVYAGSTRSIFIYDVSNPLNPVVIGGYSFSETPAPSYIGHALVGDYLISAGSTGDNVDIYDVSDPSAPNRVRVLRDSSRIDNPQFPVVVNSTYAVIVQGIDTAGMVVLNISNPPMAMLAGSNLTGIWGREAVLHTAAQRLFVAANPNLHVLDVSNLPTLTKTATYAIPGAFGGGTEHDRLFLDEAQGLLVFVSRSSRRVFVIDVGVPDYPVLVNVFSLPLPQGVWVNDARLVDGRLWILLDNGQLLSMPLGIASG